MDFSKLYKPKPGGGDVPAEEGPADVLPQPPLREPGQNGAPEAPGIHADAGASGAGPGDPPRQGSHFAKLFRTLTGPSTVPPAGPALGAGAAGAPGQPSAAIHAAAGAGPRAGFSRSAPIHPADLEDNEIKDFSCELADILYQELMEFARDLLAAGASGKRIAPAELHNLCSAVLAMLKDKPYNLLALLMDAKSHAGTHAHIANVTILALYLGIRMGLSDTELELICSVALFHDIAMPQFEGIASSPRQLTAEEAAAIKGHVGRGLSITDKIFAADSRVTQRIKDISQYVHERVDGQGYPSGLKGPQIPKTGQMIGLADVYDAMTHRRPWRAPLLPYVAMIHLIQQSGVLFSRDLVKFFIENMTMFPPGCYVQLSSGDTAYVMGLNKGYVTRPKVCIVDDGGPRYVVDLLANQAVYIKNQIHRAELNRR